MASFNRDPAVLRQVLESVCTQTPPFEFEVIVADDGSAYGAPDVCKDFPVRYHRIDRPSVPRNSSVGHNAAYRRATGDIVIAQSDDVVHVSDDSIQALCRLMDENPQSMVFATVLGCGPDGEPNSVVTGVWKDRKRRAPYFFLGAVSREDLFAVGGDDEEFDRSGGQSYEDRWLGECLRRGRQLRPIYTNEVRAHHLWHPTRVDKERTKINEAVFNRKMEEATATGVWCSSDGPWEVVHA
jgi:glycosyltransferase involved in cell wall biosynthesis